MYLLNGEWMQRKSVSCCNPGIQFLQASYLTHEDSIQVFSVLVWVWVAPSPEHLNNHSVWKRTFKISNDAGVALFVLPTYNVTLVFCRWTGVNRPTEDKCLVSAVDGRGNSGPGVSVTLPSEGNGKGMSVSVSSEVWCDTESVESTPVLLNSVVLSLTSVPCCGDTELLQLFLLTESSGGSFPRDSDVVVSSEGELILWLFRKETLFVLPCVLPSSESSKSLIVPLLLPALKASVRFFLDLRSSLKKSVNYNILYGQVDH